MQVELLCVLVSGAEKYDIWTHIYSNAQRKVIKPATMQHWIFIEMNMTRLTGHEEKSLKFCRHFCLSKHLWLSSWCIIPFHHTIIDRHNMNIFQIVLSPLPTGARPTAACRWGGCSWRWRAPRHRPGCRPPAPGSCPPIRGEYCVAMTSSHPIRCQYLPVDHHGHVEHHDPVQPDPEPAGGGEEGEPGGGVQVLANQRWVLWSRDHEVLCDWSAGA